MYNIISFVITNRREYRNIVSYYLENVISFFDKKNISRNLYLRPFASTVYT